MTPAPHHPFYTAFEKNVRAHGGLHNAHLHLCRVYTLPYHAEGGALSSTTSLQAKHNMISALHGSPAYAPDVLHQRLSLAAEEMARCGTRLADTVVDVTDDGLGFTALEAVQAVNAGREDGLTIRAGSYNPLGFRDDMPDRWRLFEEGARKADFIGALPEVDDTARYPERIGFEESLTRITDLSRRLGKFAHVHLDQLNRDDEDATETLLSVLRRDSPIALADGSPAIWAIHVISPSTYDEARFARLVEGLRECNVGVICCPSGALGMRQIRPRLTPTGNSIARVLDFAAAGVPVRLGSDNVGDMLSPSTTLNLYDEVLMLTAALRFYEVGVLAKLAAGVDLTEDDRASVQDHLDRDRREIDLALRT